MVRRQRNTDNMQGGSEVNVNNVYTVTIGKCDVSPSPLPLTPEARATLTPQANVTRAALLAQAANVWDVPIASLRVWNHQLATTLPAGRPVTLWLVKPFAAAGGK